MVQFSGSRSVELFFDASENYDAAAKEVGEGPAEAFFKSMQTVAEQLVRLESENIHDIACKATIWYVLSPEDARCRESATTDELLAFQIMGEITKLAMKSGWDAKKY